MLLAAHILPCLLAGGEARVPHALQPREREKFKVNRKMKMVRLQCRT
jgi:hypothetical protein